MDIPIIKIKVTADNLNLLLWQDILIISTEDGKEKLKRIDYGEEVNADIRKPSPHLKRSLTQLGLYWASCKEVSENTDDQNWNTKDKVDEQTKITLRHVDFWIYYHNQKTGEQTVHLKTKSISFKQLAHLDACGFFTSAFEIHAEMMRQDVDSWIEIVQSRMRGTA